MGPVLLDKRFPLRRQVLLREDGVHRAGVVAEDRSAVERFFASAACPIAPVLSLATTEAVKQAVLAGLGVAMLPEMAVTAEFHTGVLRTVTVRGMKLGQTLHWVEPDGRPREKATQAFWCVVEHAAAGKLPPPRAVNRG